MQTTFAGKNIVVGITGSIAAFKVAGWVSELSKNGAIVSVIMTSSATKFVTPLTFSTLSGNDVHTEMFSDDSTKLMDHINIGQDADVILIAPATAHTIAKLAGGLADGLLTTTILASKAKILICPAMNSRMYSHRVTRDNIDRLKGFGYTVIDPDYGTMACKQEGIGRLPDWRVAQDYLAKSLSCQDLRGHRIMVTAGPTREALDPARFISNRSTGQMGYAMARNAFRRGGEVILITGPTSLPDPAGITVLKIQTAKEMYEAVFNCAAGCSVVVKTAAVTDFRPQEVFENKLKKEDIHGQLPIEQCPDILMDLGCKKGPGQVLVGFAAESQNLQQEGMKKFRNKNLDLLAINNITGDDTGFETANNQIDLIGESGIESLPHTSKLHTAELIWDRIVPLLCERDGKGK